MACSKYTLTNTGLTITNFNYRRCDDSLWEYQVDLESNETKNVWLINDTYSTSYNNIEITNVISWPPDSPIIYSFPIWDKSPYTTDDCLQFVQALGSSINENVTPTISAITTSLGTSGWNGGVVAPNGMIYFAPGSATQIVKLNPTTDTFSLVGPVLSGLTNKYMNGVLAPNGYIYFIPNRNGNILKLDPSNDNVIQISASFGNGAYNGCILSPQGYIYGVPQSTSSILKFNTSTDTYTTFAAPSVNVSANKWCGATLAADGKIYMMPNSCNAVLELDPETDEMVTYVIYDTALRNQYLGTVLSPSGLIYGIPNESFQTMYFDPTTKTATFTSGGGYAYNGALGPNGVIYTDSIVGNNLIAINTLDNTFTNYTVTGRPTSGYWYGGGVVMSLDGNVYGAANNTSGVFWKISFTGFNVISNNRVLSRQMNH